MGDKYYFGDIDGRNRIFNWFWDEFAQYQTTQRQAIKEHLYKGENDLGYRIFKQLVNEVIEDGDTLGYLIQTNRSKYGDTVIIDLFRRYIRAIGAKKRPRLDEKQLEREYKRSIPTTAKEARKQLPRVKYFKGINKNGDYEKANLVITKRKKDNKIIERLYSAKTGKQLKQTKTFKKLMKGDKND